MKPTPEQVKAWIDEVGPTPTMERTIRMCELASKWGASQQVKALAQGVSVEPYATLHHDDGYFTTKQREHDLRYSGPMRTDVFTLDQLTTAIAAARVQALEEAAKVCKALSDEYNRREGLKCPELKTDAETVLAKALIQFMKGT